LRSLLAKMPCTPLAHSMCAPVGMIIEFPEMYKLIGDRQGEVRAVNFERVAPFELAQ